MTPEAVPRVKIRTVAHGDVASANDVVVVPIQSWKREVIVHFVGLEAAHACQDAH